MELRAEMREGVVAAATARRETHEVPMGDPGLPDWLRDALRLQKGLEKASQGEWGNSLGCPTSVTVPCSNFHDVGNFLN